MNLSNSLTPGRDTGPRKLREPLWLIAYDVADAKRWQRLYRLVCRQGIHLQRSVFLLPISDAAVHRLAEEIRAIIDTDVDDVRLYHLPVGTRIWHDGPPPAEGVLIGIADLDRLC